MPTSFVLYSRSYCHLCDDMQLALAHCAGAQSYTVEVLDVDEDPGLLEIYDALVPVLFGRRSDGKLQRLCHYFLDHDAVRVFFAESAAPPTGTVNDRGARQP